MKKFLLGAAVAAFSMSANAANSVIDEIGGYIGGQIGMSDQSVLSGSTSSDADMQGFVFGLDYADFVFLDATISKYEMASSSDLDVTELDIGYLHPVDQSFSVQASLGYRTLALDESNVDVSSVAVKAAAVFHPNDSIKTKLGYEYADETVEMNSLETGGESKGNVYGALEFSPSGEHFAMKLMYRALYKESSLTISYHF